MLKSCVVGGVVGGPCNSSVSPSPFGLWDFGLGLDNMEKGPKWVKEILGQLIGDPKIS